MITPEELNRLQGASVANPDAEPEFVRALLDAPLYTHAPLQDDSPRLRFVMFTHPVDHALTIPLFTNKATAGFAAHGNERIVSIPGRLLFEAPQGASLTINPLRYSTRLEWPEQPRTLRRTPRQRTRRREKCQSKTVSGPGGHQTAPDRFC